MNLLSLLGLTLLGVLRSVRSAFRRCENDGEIPQRQRLLVLDGASRRLQRHLTIDLAP